MATILVAEDEPAIRALTVRILELAGHRVIACADGASAIAVTEPFDLLLTDYVLPDMNGQQLIDHLRSGRPDLPLILMSGYLPDADMPLAQPAMFLQKPMRPAVIRDAVEKMLSGR
ncbi:MAG: response regulator [Acidobacteria bacterium]|jgi:CheY-like chemotaxis protein|nr:response regulator [Acidobacteriota bacterium]